MKNYEQASNLERLKWCKKQAFLLKMDKTKDVND